MEEANENEHGPTGPGHGTGPAGAPPPADPYPETPREPPPGGDNMDGVHVPEAPPTQVEPLDPAARQEISARLLAAGIQQDAIHIFLDVLDKVGVPALKGILLAAGIPL